MGHRFAHNTRTKRFSHRFSVLHWLSRLCIFRRQLKGVVSVLHSGGRPVSRILGVVVALLVLQGCTAMVVGTAVGVAATVAVETAKVPFKVTGAVIDAATDDDEDGPEN